MLNSKKIILDKKSPVPLYFQAEKIIREKIYFGELKIGEKLPPENELGRIFNISRITLRMAISNLVKSGLIEIRRGDGSYVSSKSFSYTTSPIRSFSDEAIKKGFFPKTIILDFKVIEPSKKLSEFFYINREEKVFYIKRLRILDNNPIGLDTVYIPKKICPNLSKEDFREEGEGQSFFNILRTSYGIVLKRGYEIIEAVSLSKKDAILLEVDESKPALLTKRYLYSELNQSIAYLKAIYLSPFSITLESN